MMKQFLGFVTLSAFLACVSVPAEAKGCIKGALIGGIAGHFAGHHGTAGAAAGCVIGHHEANTRQTEHTRQQQRTPQ